MADDIERVEQRTSASGDTVVTTKETASTRQDATHHQNVAERVIWLAFSILLALLGLRFLLSLLGANPNNSFADFIYSTSEPFVSPFFSLFRYDNYVYGVARFEAYTLVAMVIYILIAWGVAKLVTINRE